jgi:hypothetical protein
MLVLRYVSWYVSWYMASDVGGEDFRQRFGNHKECIVGKNVVSSNY